LEEARGSVVEVCAGLQYLIGCGGRREVVVEELLFVAWKQQERGWQAG